MNAVLRAMLGTVGLLFVACAFCGCEDDSGVEGRSFTIIPAQVAVSVETGATALRVEGGTPPYAWSVADSMLGSIASGAEFATYTRSVSNGVNVVTVTDANQWKAECVVTQKAQ